MSLPLLFTKITNIPLLISCTNNCLCIIINKIYLLIVWLLQYEYWFIFNSKEWSSNCKQWIIASVIEFWKIKVIKKLKKSIKEEFSFHWINGTELLNRAGSTENIIKIFDAFIINYERNWSNI